MEHRILLTNGEIVRFPDDSKMNTEPTEHVEFTNPKNETLAWIPKREILYILDKSISAEPSRKL